MGSLIARLVAEAGELTLVGAVERAGHPLLGRDVGEFAPDVKITDDLPKVMATADVLIDFTSAEASLIHARTADAAGKAIVVGSTGFTPEQKAELRGLRNARVFFSPNLSVSMNVLFKLVHEAARLLGDDYDVEIVETHHRFKKDSPSGSAMRLAEAAAGALGRDLATDAVYGREGIVGERTKREIGIHAVRAGDVVGDHTVIFGALGERLEFTHKVSSRETFARGAVRAAAWISRQPPGVYDMMDLLGLN
jgi:4-hydroxy-tetrahydrodipicolinate reductase